MSDNIPAKVRMAAINKFTELNIGSLFNSLII